MNLSPQAQIVQKALSAHGLDLKVLELPASTRTAQEAALAIGCQVAQIVKSLIFRGRQSGLPFYIAVSGVNRVNEAQMEKLLGEPIEKATPEFVRQQTGFSIGGVPPVGHSQPMATLIDQDLFQWDVIWAAAGTPNAVFQLTPADLMTITRGRVISVT